MNHSGNEHLSSGSPRAGLLTKEFASNIYYTLYTLALAKAAETQLDGRSARPDQTSEKRGKISVCQKNDAGDSATQIFSFFSSLRFLHCHQTLLFVFYGYALSD